MALNDTMFNAQGLGMVAKPVGAGVETQIFLNGADSGNHPLVPCAGLEVKGQAGAATIKVATMAGEIGAGRFKTIAPGGSMRFNRCQSNMTLFVLLDIAETVEVTPC